LIDTIDSVYRWFDGHRSEKTFMIDCRYYRSKIQKSSTDGSITSMKMRPKVSIDTIGIDPSIHHQLCPSMHMNITISEFSNKNASSIKSSHAWDCWGQPAFDKPIHLVHCPLEAHPANPKHTLTNTSKPWPFSHPHYCTLCKPWPVLALSDCLMYTLASPSTLFLLTQTHLNYPRVILKTQARAHSDHAEQTSAIPIVRNRTDC
jgi:hypothetical protein